MQKKKIDKIILSSIIIIAIILRLIAIFKYGDFWDDEIFNFTYSQKKWPEGLKWWLWETNPPLHLLILKIWYFIAPQTEFWTRFPSLIIGILSVFAIYKIGEKIFNQKIAILASIFLAIHSYHIFWSVTARIYVFLMFFTLLSTYYFWEIFINQNNKTKLKIYFSLTNLFLIFSHLTASFVFLGQLLYLLITQKFSEIKKWLKINWPMILFGLSWISISLFLKINNNLEKSWFLNLNNSWQYLLNPITNLIIGLSPALLNIFIIIFTLFIIGKNTKKAIKHIDYNFLSLVLIGFTPIILSMALGVWHIKFFVLILPIFILLISKSIFELKYKYFFISFFIISFLISYFLLIIFKLPITKWSEVADFYQKNYKEQTIFLYNYQILEPQIEKYLPDLYPQSLPLNLYPHLNKDEIMVTKNYLFKKFTADEINNWLDEKNIEQFERIILLQNEYNFSNNLSNFLLEKKWIILDSPKPVKINGKYLLYVFVKNSNN